MLNGGIVFRYVVEDPLCASGISVLCLRPQCLKHQTLLLTFLCSTMMLYVTIFFYKTSLFALADPVLVTVHSMLMLLPVYSVDIVHFPFSFFGENEKWTFHFLYPMLSLKIKNKSRYRDLVFQFSSVCAM